MSIFELVDKTDEMYYPVGIFLSLSDAIEAVEKEKEPWMLSEFALDSGYVKLEIREREVGFCQHGKVVWTMEWEDILSDDGYESEWVRRD
jgi:hypothetical protein